jgi:hypothetical protein
MRRTAEYLVGEASLFQMEHGACVGDQLTAIE